MDSEKIIKKFDSIDGNISRMKVVTVIIACIMGFVMVGSVVSALYYADVKSEQIYVLDQGRSLIAMQTTDKATKHQEILQHVKLFHQYFFNLAPNEESIKRNMEHAYHLCDGSARKYFNDLQESNFYNRLISNNIVQYVDIDSVAVNTKVYPYEAKTYATMTLQRATTLTYYELVTICQLVDTQRSESNTNGLMMENFTVLSQKKVDTKYRNQE